VQEFRGRLAKGDERVISFVFVGGNPKISPVSTLILGYAGQAAYEKGNAL
jgi:hypothetical protein